MLFTSGLDNLTNDFPFDTAFVPFIEQTARYLAGGERQGGARPVDAFLELRNAKEQSFKASRSPTLRRSVRSPWARPPPRSRSRLTEAGYFASSASPNGRRDEVRQPRSQSPTST